LAEAPVVDPSWQSAVVNWLAEHKTYPDESRRRGEEGRVVIRFTVDRSGHVSDATVTTSSGIARLDEATLALMRDASLPRFPATMTRDRITITTSVRYTLR
jgi:protein TonB